MRGTESSRRSAHSNPRGGKAINEYVPEKIEQPPSSSTSAPVSMFQKILDVREGMVNE